MKIITTSIESFSKISAGLVADKINQLQINSKRPVNLVLATGRTMIQFLDELSQQSVDWNKVNIFHLDEYKGLDINHPSSFAFFINQNFISKIKIPQQNINFINGQQPDLTGYINKLNQSGGSDITMLGVGLDGHLAFNEPPLYSQFDSRIREVDLTPSTIEANQADYPEISQNPHAFTLGMADIFESKYVFFLAKGQSKSQIVHQALTGQITPDIPASILQKHPNATVILDTQAASLLK